MNECIFISNYGKFDSVEKMQDDYYNSTTKKTIYKKRYKIILDEIESQFSVTLKDVDWIMTLHQGVEEIDLSYIVLNEINFNSELNKINSRQS